jgi:HSP20 family protein
MTLFNALLPSLGGTPVAQPEAKPADLTYSVKPVYQITENDDAYAVVVELPGVAKDALEVTAEENQIRVVGRRAWKQPEGWTALHRESADAPYELVLAHDNAIDVAKVSAELRDGLLRLTLPKHEAVKPRKIAIA